MGKLQKRLSRELTLYVRQLAWLQATPKPAAGSRREKVLKDEPRLSRFDKLKRKKIEPAMPPIGARHIFDRLVEMGMTEAAGMGAAPISWREIDAWCARTGVDLDPWESRLIRSLSAAYIAEGRRAETETCPPPWRAPITQRERDADNAALDALLG